MRKLSEKREIAIQSQGSDSTPIAAQADLKRAGHFDAALARIGPLAEYLPTHAALYRSRTPSP